jgi:hypothetical protein
MEGSVPDTDEYDDMELPEELQTHPEESDSESTEEIAKNKNRLNANSQLSN